MFIPTIFSLLIFGLSTAGAEICPTPAACAEFKKQESNCRANKKKCDGFLKVYKTLVDKYDCKRDFDNDPVPAVWLCSNHEPSVDLLKSLKSQAAKKFYKSEKFQATLDGALADGDSDGTE